MGWKDLKYWKKGFIIGTGLHVAYLIFFVILLVLEGDVGENSVWWYFFLTDVIPASPFLFFLSNFSDSMLYLVLAAIISTILYGFLGSLIGLVFGKLKKR